MEYKNHIGTPLTPNATRVLLLGGGELGRGLALAFQKLGLEVHAVDRYESAPACQVAHFHYVADIRDAAAVYELCQQIRPDFVVPEVETVAVDALERIEENTDIAVVPSAKACRLTQDRETIRDLACNELGLPTTSFRFANSADELRQAVDELGLPCIVKPDVATSGKGHMLVQDAEDIAEAWERVHRVGTEDQQVIAERVVDFDYEVTLLAVRSIDPATGNLATWFPQPIGHRHESGNLVESWQPMEMTEGALENARSVAARISNALGGRGVYGVELFVAGDDVYFSSVSPRPSDTAMLTEHTQRYSEFDLHARAMLGYPIDVTMTSPGASVVLTAEQELADVSYAGVGHAMSLSETDVRLFGKPDAYPGRRMGLVMSTAESVNEARDRAALAARKITIDKIPTPEEDAESGAREFHIEKIDGDVVTVDREGEA